MRILARMALFGQDSFEIVCHFRAARDKGEIHNKEAWARTNHNISGRTLFNYEREL